MDERVKDLDSRIWTLTMKEIKERHRGAGSVGWCKAAIAYLLLRIEELGERIELAEATRDDALAYVKMFKEKLVEEKR